MERSLPITESLQDYLEVILSLSDDLAQPIRVTDIAAKLDIAKASVTQALGILKKRGLIIQDRYGPVELTELGRRHALKIRYRHEILRCFLTDGLGVSDEIAEKDACLIEHDLSTETFERLLAFLEKAEFIQQQERKVFRKKIADILEEEEGT